MVMDEESNKVCQNELTINDEQEEAMNRHQLFQESRTDIEFGLRNVSNSLESSSSDSNFEDDVTWTNETETEVELHNRTLSEEHQASSSCNDDENFLQEFNEVETPQIVSDGNDEEMESSVERLERFENYLERYGPQLERYGEQLERFGSQLERIGPHLERCGSNLERYGPQLEAIGRQLERTGSQPDRNIPDLERLWGQQNQLNLQTQTESGSEGFSPQSADSCQGTSVGPTTWVSTSHPRNLSRRPSFQINDGLLRRWMRRRNAEGRDMLSFSRYRDERERRRSTIWRNTGELREYRRSRAVGSRSYHENFAFSSHPPSPVQNEEPEENSQNDIIQNRPLRPQVLNDQQENGGLLQQNHVRILRRSSSIHQDDPDFGFVMVNNQNSPGPSRPDTSCPPERRPRSHMSLRPLNVSFPPQLGPIAEYGVESEDDNNDIRPESVRRRSVRRNQGSTVRSWVLMNNFLQPRPIFIGQGDSKAMDGPFTLQRVQTDDNLLDGNDRNGIDNGIRNQRLAPRIERLERRHTRHQLS